MDVESSSPSSVAVTTAVALHPLSIVHMSDQYTRITSGGSPLDKSSPVVGLLFGLDEERYVASSTQSAQPRSTTTTTTVLQIKDADDIPVEISDASRLQVELHTAVFPQHRVVGWYRVSCSSVGGGDNDDDEPTAQDLQITQQLKSHYASSSDNNPNSNNNNGKSFCFCLLNVQKEQQKQKKKKNDGEDTKMKSSDEETEDDDDEDGSSTLNNELPINLFELKDIVNGNGVSATTTVLVNIPDWQLETSDAERIAVERVMNEKPSEVEDGSPSHNPYIVQTKSLQLSLKSMKDRVKVIIQCLEQMQDGTIPPDPSLLRQIQSLVSSLGPLSTLADGCNVDGLNSAAGHYSSSSNAAANAADDVELLSHLALVAKTVSAVQSYTEKFRVMHENRNSSTSTTTMSGGGSSGAGSIRSSAKDAIRQFGGF